MFTPRNQQYNHPNWHRRGRPYPQGPLESRRSEAASKLAQAVGGIVASLQDTVYEVPRETQRESDRDGVEGA
jgi:hypothetical protein